MSRLTDSMREQAKRSANIAVGLRMAGDRELAHQAAVAAHALTTAADALDAYEGAERLAAERRELVNDVAGELIAAARSNGGLAVFSPGAR